MIAVRLWTSTATALPRLSGWEVLRDDTVWIGCTWADGQPWCRAAGEVDATVAQVVHTLMGFEGYPDVFEHVQSVTMLDEDLVLLTLDMPFPMSTRDHVPRFVRHDDDGEIVIGWEPAVHPDAPTSKAIRLSDNAGEWRLVAAGSRTEVHYTWQADLRGDLPGWALPRARLTQGSEALESLDAALQR